MNKDSLLIMMWKNKLPDVALIKALFDLLFLIFVDFRSWDQICDLCSKIHRYKVDAHFRIPSERNKTLT